MKHQTSDELGILTETDQDTLVPAPAKSNPAPVRQWLNHWNWRKKTALVTALAITATGTFYHQRSHAAWPVVLTVGYGITVGLNAAFDSNVLKETAIADSRN